MLFQRMYIASHSESKLKDYCKSELGPFPMLLFIDEGMWKGMKSLLYADFVQLTVSLEIIISLLLMGIMCYTKLYVLGPLATHTYNMFEI